MGEDIVDETPQQPPDNVIQLAPVADAANRARQDKPFFTVLPRPQWPDCDHSRRGVEIDRTKRTVYCKCGAQLDPLDALLIYAATEQRLVSTRADIERHQREEAEKKQREAERKPFLREVRGFYQVCNPTPPNGDGAMVGYDVSLSCGHTIRWASRGRRHPKQRLTCDVCLRMERAKTKGNLR